MMLAVAFSSVINIAAGVLIPVCDSTPFTICFTFLCRNAQQEGSRLKVCGSGMGSFRCTLPPPPLGNSGILQHREYIRPFLLP